MMLTKGWVGILAIGIGWVLASGCTISRTIKPIATPQNQIHLHDLENHLDYEDPDANQDDYLRE